MKYILLIAGLLIGLTVLFFLRGERQDSTAGDINAQKNESSMLLTLAAPRVDDPYYADSYQEIIRFQIEYARRIIAAGKDTVQILADAATIAQYGNELPAGVFVEAPMLDIWMRDFSPVLPANPVQFTYTDASMTVEEAQITQQTFNDFLDNEAIARGSSDLLLDGGNIVDDDKSRVITTTRFLTDNGLSKAEGKQALQELLGAHEVAIVEPDDDALAHADGMVAWIDDGVLAVNDYSALDPEFHETVMSELTDTFTDVRFVLIPVQFDDESNSADPQIGSACGVNINLVSTPTTLYVPTFGMSHEAEALRIIKENTTKQVVKVPADGVCRFGGSARCTVWQRYAN